MRRGLYVNPGARGTSSELFIGVMIRARTRGRFAPAEGDLSLGLRLSPDRSAEASLGSRKNESAGLCGMGSGWSDGLVDCVVVGVGARLMRYFFRVDYAFGLRAYTLIVTR